MGNNGEALATNNNKPTTSQTAINDQGAAKTCPSVGQ